MLIRGLIKYHQIIAPIVHVLYNQAENHRFVAIFENNKNGASDGSGNIISVYIGACFNKHDNNTSRYSSTKKCTYMIILRWPQYENEAGKYRPRQPEQTPYKEVYR